MSNCKIHGKDCYDEWWACAECNELVNKQELSRLRSIEAWAKEAGKNLELDIKMAQACDGDVEIHKKLLRRLDAITAPVEAKPEPKMHTDAFGQPLIGRAKQ